MFAFQIRACRTCLNAENEHNTLLNGEDWLALLEYCIGINIKVQDEPQSICRKCADIICNFSEFKKKCLATDALWKSVTSDDNLKCLIHNYTTEVENVMKKKLLDNQNINDIPHEKNNEIKGHIIQIKDEENKLIAIDIKNLVNDDHAYGNDDALDNDSDNFEERLQMLDNKSQTHEDKMIRNNNMITGSLKCQKCNKVYGRVGWLKMHMTLCGKSKDEKKEIRKNNKKTQEHLCGLCRFTSKSEQLVSQHFEEHCSRNDLRCELCEFVGRDFADMVAHRLSHNSKAFKVKKSCPTCKKTFVSRLSMQFHYRSAHLNKNGGYCSKCGIEFSVYKTFESHVRTHGGRKYVCDICGLRFFIRSRIIEHLKNHKEINHFICHECGKGFKQHKNLLFHMRTVHVKEKPLKCTHCNKMFKNLYTLKMHRKRQLGMKMSLKCEFCGKCFASPHLLRSHRFWHTDERPHCCEICGSRYKAKGQLKVHMLNHTGSKPFECDLCTKCFATARQLRRHGSVHTGIRPHKCSYCDRTFHSKKQVLNHCALRHKGSDLGRNDKNANK